MLTCLRVITFFRTHCAALCRVGSWQFTGLAAQCWWENRNNRLTSIGTLLQHRFLHTGVGSLCTLTGLTLINCLVRTVFWLDNLILHWHLLTALRRAAISPLIRLVEVIVHGVGSLSQFAGLHICTGSNSFSDSFTILIFSGVGSLHRLTGPVGGTWIPTETSLFQLATVLGVGSLALTGLLLLIYRFYLQRDLQFPTTQIYIFLTLTVALCGVGSRILTGRATCGCHYLWCSIWYGVGTLTDCPSSQQFKVFFSDQNGQFLSWGWLPAISFHWPGSFVLQLVTTTISAWWQLTISSIQSLVLLLAFLALETRITTRIWFSFICNFFLDFVLAPIIFFTTHSVAILD